jgi:hypothetical protein
MSRKYPLVPQYNALTTFSAGAVSTRDEISEPVSTRRTKWQAILRKSTHKAGAHGETVIEETLVSEFQASRTGDVGAGIRWWRAVDVCWQQAS